MPGIARCTFFLNLLALALSSKSNAFILAAVSAFNSSIRLYASTAAALKSSHCAFLLLLSCFFILSNFVFNFSLRSGLAYFKSRASSFFLLTSSKISVSNFKLFSIYASIASCCSVTPSFGCLAMNIFKTAFANPFLCNFK